MLRYVRASVEDQEKIRDFLRQFINDYLTDQIEQLVAQRQGGLYLALEDEQIIGTAVIALPKRHEAYLSGMRIAPSRQGQGVAEAFAKFQVAEAKRLGAVIARALVHQDNQTSLHILQENIGFQVVDGWMVGTLTGFEAPEVPPLEAGPAWAVDKERILSFWSRFADDLWAGQNLWVPHSLAMEDIWQRFEKGGVAVAPQTENQEVDTLAMYRMTQKMTMYINYFRVVEGRLASALLDYLWIEARTWGLEQVQYGLPQRQAEKFLSISGLKPTDTWTGFVLEKDLSLTHE